MRVKLFFILIALNSWAHAQTFFRSIEITLSENERVSLDAYEPFDALCFELEHPDGLILETENNGMHSLSLDLHHGANRSQLFTFSAQHGSVYLYSTHYTGKIKILLIHQGEAPAVASFENLYKKTACEKPEVIPPSVWRAGLPDPKPGRSYNQARHMIIHHSAGSNFNTNYTEVVRSIYLLHLNTNNWDDIGYNYLIAGNGNIYAGRDPQSLVYEDEVTGAHFCGKNTGTMGTCILGTYTDTVPSRESRESLHQLLLWKLAKAHIGPADSFPHPGISDPVLPVVAGHRDGCNTSCPGNEFYRLIPDIRNKLESDWQNCPKIAGMNPKNEEGSNWVYPNPLPSSENTLHLSVSAEWELYALNGLRVAQGHTENQEIILKKNICPGVYVLQFRVRDTLKTFRFVRL